LIVLDGWGHAPATDWNAITRAPAHNFLEWQQRWPSTLLSASGREVGLPLGLMGNSEVGHTNMGAGRIVYQTITRIDKAIETGEFAENGALRGAIEQARRSGGKLHLFGLLGDGGVHATAGHYAALLTLAKAMGLPGERVLFHALLDGRDTPPHSSPGFLSQLEEMLSRHGGRIASICGRYHAMDRDRNWERTQRFWDLLVHARAPFHAAHARQAVADAVARGESDEFAQPAVIGPPSPLAEGDAVIAFNFRADRMRQIIEAFLAGTDFETRGFARGRLPKIHLASMTQYRKDFPCAVAFPPDELSSLFGELVSHRGMRQFRCAETEKYAHITYFFNGGREEPYPGEERTMVPSPKVATYDLQPEMSAVGVTDQICARLNGADTDLYVINFANADMVGHSGILKATEDAVRAVDGCLKRIVDLALAHQGTVAITADHGNAEQMWDPVTQQPHTAHTTNPVPFILIGERFKGARLRKMGILADVAPTLMQAMSIQQPAVMTGLSLLELMKVR
jgi:2,3-bisphosphoglycerate-independent phosphoglycerate mutase